VDDSLGFTPASFTVAEHYVEKKAARHLSAQQKEMIVRAISQFKSNDSVLFVVNGRTATTSAK
jgi:hypothetical protein